MSSRAGIALTFYVFTSLGIFLVVAPWTPIWAHTAHALVPVSARPLFLSGWVRGTVSGLGAVDLVVACQVGIEMLRGIRRDGPG